MTSTFESIAAQALQLTPQERSVLAESLWLSVHPQDEIDAAWDAEIGRRLARIDAGEVEAIPWERVISQLKDRLKRSG